MTTRIRFGSRGRSVIRTNSRRLTLGLKETSILVGMMARPISTRADLAVDLWPEADTMPDAWHANVYHCVWRLRRKLLAVGIKIARDRGYRLALGT